MVFSPSLSVIFVSALQLENALSPMDSTVFERITSVSALHDRKAFFGIDVSPSPSLMLLRPVSAKAASPILVTLSKFTEVKFVQPRKASFSIDIETFGRTTSFIAV